MTAILRILIFSALFSTNMVSAQSGRIDFTYFKKGIKYRSFQNHVQAIKAFDQFLIKYPSAHPNAYYFRARSYMEVEQPKNAYKDFEKLIKLTPLSVDGYLGCAQIHYDNSEYEKAIEFYSKVLELDTDNAHAFNSRGMSYCYARNFDNAIHDFKAAIKYKSDFAMAYNNLGSATYYNQDIEDPTLSDLKLANSFFDKALEVQPTLYIALKSKGVMNYLLGDIEEARVDFSIAERVNNQDPSLYFLKGVTYSDEGKYGTANQYFDKALSLDKTHAFSFEEKGRVALLKGKIEDAVVLYHKAKINAPRGNKLYSGLMDFRIAAAYAKGEQKYSMLDYLKNAKNNGAFSDTRVYKALTKGADFQKYQSDNDFVKFRRSLGKIKKDNHFLSPELSWFRLRG